MEQLFVGLDVSKDETAICVRTQCGIVKAAFKKPTDPDIIHRALVGDLQHIRCVVLETGRMANWLCNELSQRGLPVVCIDARQAHAVLSQMHNKTDENDAAMLAELARTGFYKRIEVKSRVAQERRALLRAGKSGAGIGLHVNGWFYQTSTVGTYGTAYKLRGMATFIGLGVNLPEDAVYPASFVDGDGRPYSGANRYVLHFEKGKLPPANAFWSVTLYDQNGFQVSNVLNRFALGDRDKLTFNADGSLDIYI